MRHEASVLATNADVAWENGQYALAQALYARIPTDSGDSGELERVRRGRTQRYNEGVAKAEAAKDALKYDHDVQAARVHLQASLDCLPNYRRAASLEDTLRQWESLFSDLSHLERDTNWNELEKVARRILREFPNSVEARSALAFAKTMRFLDSAEGLLEAPLKDAVFAHDIAMQLSAKVAQGDYVADWASKVSGIAGNLHDLAQKVRKHDANVVVDASFVAEHARVVATRKQALRDSITRMRELLDTAFVEAMRRLLFRADLNAARTLLGLEGSPYRGIFEGIGEHYKALDGAPILPDAARATLKAWLTPLDSLLSDSDPDPEKESVLDSSALRLDEALLAFYEHVLEIHTRFKKRMLVFLQQCNWSEAVALAQAAQALTAWVTEDELARYRAQRDQQFAARSQLTTLKEAGRYAELRRKLWDETFVACLPSHEVEHRRQEATQAVKRRATIALLAATALVGLIFAFAFVGLGG